MSSELKKSILSTLAYYDVMDYPMTSFEIWKYLNNEFGSENPKITILDIMEQLDDGEKNLFWEEYNGFYFLKGRKSIVGKRLERNKISEKKHRTVSLVSGILRFVPFVRMILLTGRMSMKNTEEKSDLDLLIVLKEGRIFTGRFFVTLVAQLIGKRRHGKKISDRICLNYFISEGNLEITLKDIFSASEYFFAEPVFGSKVYKEFLKKNIWIKKYKVNFNEAGFLNIRTLKDSFWSLKVRNFLEKFFDFCFLEKTMKKFQLRKIEKNPKTRKKEGLIIANDEMLVFLPEPKSPEIFEKFQNRLASLKGLTQQKF